MLRKNSIHRAALTTLVSILAGSNSLSAQVQASLNGVKNVELELASTVRLLEQNILLALTAGVAILGIVWVAYVCNTYLRSKSLQQTDRNHFLTFMLLIVGMSMLCSSCGMTK